MYTSRFPLPLSRQTNKVQIGHLLAPGKDRKVKWRSHKRCVVWQK